MAIVVKDTGGEYEPIPTGVFPAVGWKVFDLGIVAGFQNKPTHKVVVAWEIAARKQEGEHAGKRFIVTKTYTASLNEKANLRKDLESWRGRPFTEEELMGFDVEKVIGAPCMLNLVEQVTTSGRKWTGIAAIMPLPKEGERLTAETDPTHVPAWIAKIVGEQQEAPIPPSFNDDIPF